MMNRNPDSSELEELTESTGSESMRRMVESVVAEPREPLPFSLVNGERLAEK